MPLMMTKFIFDIDFYRISLYIMGKLGWYIQAKMTRGKVLKTPYWEN
jgi:hypothetical protein